MPSYSWHQLTPSVTPTKVALIDGATFVVVSQTPKLSPQLQGKAPDWKPQLKRQHRIKTIL